jgi:hypothetical protein
MSTASAEARNRLYVSPFRPGQEGPQRQPAFDMKADP